MALPTTISSVIWPTLGSGNLGPYIYSGNVYVVSVYTLTSVERVGIYKATDPTSSFSLQDSGSGPTANTSSYNIDYCDTYFDGQYIHCMIVFERGALTSHRVEYGRFDCSSDTWVSATVYGGTGSARVIYDSTDPATTFWGGITVRSDGDVIIVHPGENPSTMGGTYQEVYYSRLEGTSLTAGVTVASTAAKNDDYLYAYPVMGSSDQCHFGYIRNTDGDFYLRALSSGNSLRTQRTLAGSYHSLLGGGMSGVICTRSSTERIKFISVQDGSSSAPTIYNAIVFNHFTDDSSPTITSETIFQSAGSGTTSIGEFSPAGVAVDDAATNQDIYYGRISSGGLTPDDDVYLYGDDGGTTWSDQNSSTAIRAGTVTGISANIYTRGGNRLYAFLYDDAGTVKYDEFILYGVGGGIVFTRRPMRFLSRSF